MNQADVSDILKSHGQDHIVDHYRRLTPDRQKELYDHIAGLDLDLVFKLHRDRARAGDVSSLSVKIGPARIVPLPRTPEDMERHAAAQSAGKSLISDRGVAVLIVAGGQGVRLGHDKPKGTFPISPIKNKTLFQLFAEQTKALQARFLSRIPLVIMTSEENHDDTVAFFNSYNYFGIDKGDVLFFSQGMLPTITPQGELLLRDDTHLLTNPDGHGGSLKALATSGILQHLIDLGIAELFYCQVDNPLVKIADPVFLGYHALAKAECSTKVVRRENINEKVGVYVSLNGKDAILEYSDFGGRHMRTLDKEGNVLYWAGNTAIHILNLAFVKRLNDHGFALPYHCATKTIDKPGPGGTPRPVDVWKFETFVFDAIPLAERTCCMEVDRREEFAPVKNKTGPDSPATACRAMARLHRQWLEEAGIRVPPELKVEISPLFALDKKDLAERLREKKLSVQEDTYLG
ncbi:MAG: putative uridylyltransferase [Syntrophorhabdus sp. PtaU1.Bin153]|nr:MAG: putative uridylyltransferase [Syntrophorhabdus sp. PtaU1.Bin153]